MSNTITADVASTSVPLPFLVTLNGVGQTGQAPTVALRRASGLNSYLDWSDNTFKTSGWTTKYATMSEVERGHYQKTVSMVAIAAAAGDYFSVEYHVDNGSTVVGDENDTLRVTAVASEVTMVRQLGYNKLILTPGLPGILDLYNDAGTLIIKTANLYDYLGGAIVGAAGAPTTRGGFT